MSRFLRAVTVAVSAALALPAIASPGAAEEALPPTCTGVEYFVCTGNAIPPNDGYLHTMHVVGVDVDPVRVLPGMLVGGQPIGGVAIVLGGQTIGGVNTSVGGPTSPVGTGVYVPANVCLVVTCYRAGQEVVVPGVSLPVVPVVIPGVTVPTQTVTVPYVGNVPTVATPAVWAPPYAVDLVVFRVLTTRTDILTVAGVLCEAGGGTLRINYYYEPAWYECANSSTTALVHPLLWAGGYRPIIF